MIVSDTFAGLSPRRRHRQERAAYGTRIAASIALVLVALVGVGPLVASTSAHPGYPGEPALIVVPPKPFGPRAELRLEVHVAAPGGVERVVAMVRGEHDAEYRSVVMEPAGESSFVARLEAWPERGDVVHYYLRACDTAGDPLAGNGEALNPFVARTRKTKGVPPMMTNAGAWRQPIWIATGLLVLTAVLGTWLHFSPYRKSREVPLPRQRAERAVVMPYLQASLDRIEEDIFWFLLLSPLVDLPEDELEPQLAALAHKTHQHPTHGDCRLAPTTIRMRLFWMQRVDRRELLARRNALLVETGRKAAGPHAG